MNIFNYEDYQNKGNTLYNFIIDIYDQTKSKVIHKILCENDIIYKRLLLSFSNKPLSHIALPNNFNLIIMISQKQYTLEVNKNQNISSFTYILREFKTDDKYLNNSPFIYFV